MVTLTIGGVSYAYFTKNFNNQVEKVNQKMLEHLYRTMEETIFNKIENLYLDISTDLIADSGVLFFFNHPVDGNHARIAQVYYYLKDIVLANHDIVKSVFVYYRKNDMVISSAAGLKYLEQYKLNTLDDAQYISRLEQTDSNTIWLMSDVLNSETNTLEKEFIFLRTYPYTTLGIESKGCIGIHVKSNALLNIMKQSSFEDMGKIFLVDREGQIFSGSNESDFHSEIYKGRYFDKIMSTDETYNDFIADVNGVKSMVSFITIKQADWKLVNITPVEVFYEQSAMIQRALIIICILVLLVGMVISNIFTMNIYNPLKAILDNVKKMFGNPTLHNEKFENEYIFIDNVINNLSVKVVKLENTINANLPIIKHNFVIGLLNNNLHNETEINNRLRFLNLTFPGSFFRAAVLQLDEKTIENINVENIQFIKYNLIQQIESISDYDNLYLAAELSDYQIGIIANTRTKDKRTVIKVLNQLISYIHSNFIISAIASIGKEVESSMEIHTSFAECKLLLKYAYFFPRKAILEGEEILIREQSEEEIPSNILDKFGHELKNRNLEGLGEAISIFGEHVLRGNYSANHCHRKIAELLYIFNQYLDSISYLDIDGIKSNISTSFSNVKNFIEFQHWIFKAANDVFEHIASRSKTQMEEIIGKVKEYVIQHIDGELSLDSVAEKVYLSPRYLSKVFKEVTGTNFTDFITEQRMEKAKELLLNSDMSIEEISKKVGYNSSAYFIKKFKEFYGATPKNYKYKTMVLTE